MSLKSLENEIADLQNQFIGSGGGVFNVMAAKYGAKGDGVNDDHDAIQAAINDAATQYSRTNGIIDVQFPSGFKFFTSPLLIDSGVRLWLEGATITPNIANWASTGFLKGKNSGIPGSILKDAGVVGGTWLGTGQEVQNHNMFAIGPGPSTQLQDFTIRNARFTGWGINPLNLKNPTGLRVYNNRLYGNEFNLTGFTNSIDIYADGSAPFGGEILVAQNRLHNSIADSICLVITDNSVGGPMNFTVIGNIATADPPIVHPNVTLTNGQSIVLDPAAAAGDLLQYVTTPTPGMPKLAQIIAVNPGVSYTLNVVYTGTNTSSATLYVRVYRNAIFFEADNALAGNPHSDITFIGNSVVGYERATMGVSEPSGKPLNNVLIQGNRLFNGQIGAGGNFGGNNPQGVGFGMTGSTSLFDVSLAYNHITCASAPAVPEIYKDVSLVNSGVVRGNKFTADAADGSATLVSGSVTINTVEVRSTDRIVVWRKDTGSSTALGELMPANIVNGVSFDIQARNIATPGSIQSGDLSNAYWKLEH